MKKAALLTTSLLAVLMVPSLSVGEEFLLYLPKPASGEKAPANPSEGVLVRKVTVKPGDTLKKISRRHTGVASWFPQVLVFNTIKNPDLIHPGDELLVPVKKGSEAGESSAKGKKHPAAKSKKARHHRLKRVRAGQVEAPKGEKAAEEGSGKQVNKPAGSEAVAPPVAPKQEAASAPQPGVPAKSSINGKKSKSARSSKSNGTKGTAASPAAEQDAYQQAKRAYLKGEYRQSLALFDTFLKKFPNSPLASDASLYRADCYLRLSSP
ncbi:LysM peptidoglycan-binding domain-containing protein [Geomonas sp. Red32]|uniref:LysM peptidoglycan-binding domain-containing protein n=1 Tax=Geomonas sp. Red32 TaxID=2912856 RepID=UPI00202CF5FA|nr:LysM peptidoglycan-binding domain-containing protein [Geomonas sp. Red32]MCM0080021.1 LysM peptidoglycan-binding domain-containing protein [Geomonas sp. Red32]